MRFALKVLAVVLFIVYPFAIYLGINYFEPKALAVFFAAMLLLRYITLGATVGSEKKQANIVLIIGVVIVVYTILSNDVLGLKFYPAIISFTFLFVFFSSLYFPPSVVERIARIGDPELSEAGVVYTKNVTKIWCVFFLTNGITALYIGLFESFEIWALYNGLISYLIMGSLFVIEYIYRKVILSTRMK